jgi:hypothetical protein
MPMFLKGSGGSLDDFRWLPEQLYQCCSSISGGPQTIFDDFRSDYTNVSRVPWWASRLSLATTRGNILMSLKCSVGLGGPPQHTAIFSANNFHKCSTTHQHTGENCINLLYKSWELFGIPPTNFAKHCSNCSGGHEKRCEEPPKYSRNIDIVAPKVIGNSLGAPQNTRETLVKLLRKSSKLVWRPPKTFGKYWYDIPKIFDKVPQNYFFDVRRFRNLTWKKFF